MSKEEDLREGGFEARNLRFVYVDNPSLLNEIMFSKITLKHFIGLLLAAFLGIIAINTGNITVIVICLTIALLTLACAFYPPKALSLEAILIGFLFTILDMITQKGEKKQIVKVRPEKPKREAQELPKITVKINLNDLIREKYSLAELLEYESQTKRKLRELKARKREEQK